MDAERPPHRVDAVFCDTCIGGSTVAARVGRRSAGLRACFLADYAVNPLGTKGADEVRAALESWFAFAAARSDLVIVACNTASVLLEAAPDVRRRAESSGLRVRSMVDLFDAVLEREAVHLSGSRVCLMGTRFTVGADAYARRLLQAGAREVFPLAATRTERAVARLAHLSEDGRREIEDEVGGAIRSCDAVVLACTCFPLVGAQIRTINPGCRLIDPAAGLDHLPWPSGSADENRLTVVLTGDALSPALLEAQSPVLFPGWTVVGVACAASPGQATAT